MEWFLPAELAYIDGVEIFKRLCFAAAFGALLGLDREVRDRNIGVRTYMMVSLGAAGFALLTMELSVSVAQQELGSDPTRLIQGLIGAIGFLGAGAIIQSSGQLGGMVTAASIWAAGAIGMAAGLGFFLHAVLITCFAAAVLALSWLLPNRGAEDRPDLDEKDDRETGT